MKKLSLLFATFALSFQMALADEGMWLLPLLQKLNANGLKKAGLQISPEDIYSINKSSLKDAIVIFGGGCTGEIISKDGLILTNHHCGYGSIQQLSSVEHNYLQDGFWAMSREQEIPAPGLSVTFLDRMEDVSAQINAALDTCTSEASRSKVIMTLGNEISKKATGDSKYLRARVVPMYGGNIFYLVVSKVYSDIRFVGAPPSSIGKYGADTDNWIWPRHTGDFSMFRVYVDKDNNPAAYASDNQPLNAKKHLTISLKGVKAGDFNMIMGHPGTTTRFMTSAEVQEQRDLTNEIGVYVRGKRQEIMLDDMLADPKVQLQYASKYSGSSNAWKKWMGMNETFKKLDVIERRAADEQAFNKWMAADPARQAKYSNAVNDINSAVAGRRDIRYQQRYLSESIGNIEIAGIAMQLRNFLSILEKNDQAEIAKTIDRLKPMAKRYFENYNQPTDHKVTLAMIKIYADKVAKAKLPSFYQVIDQKYKGSVENYVIDLFAKSFCATEEKFNAFLKNPTVDAIKNDPAVALAGSISQKATELSNAAMSFNEQLSRGQRAYIGGTVEMNKGKALYPDANFTMRLTYGSVMGYSPKDAVDFNYYTTQRGILEKEDPNNWEFVLPTKLKELLKNKDFGKYALPNGDLPVCFIDNLDITGGNSGSPVLNGKGELVGCAFDGNWESMSSDIIFEPSLQRCIAVDIRYVLFIVDKFGGAGHLLNEMTFAK